MGDASYELACNMIRFFISPLAIYPLSLDSEDLGTLGAAMRQLPSIMFNSINTNLFTTYPLYLLCLLCQIRTHPSPLTMSATLMLPRLQSCPDISLDR